MLQTGRCRQTRDQEQTGRPGVAETCHQAGLGHSTRTVLQSPTHLAAVTPAEGRNGPFSPGLSFPSLSPNRTVGSASESSTNSAATTALATSSIHRIRQVVPTSSACRRS